MLPVYLQRLDAGGREHRGGVPGEVEGGGVASQRIQRPDVQRGERFVGVQRGHEPARLRHDLQVLAELLPAVQQSMKSGQPVECLHLVTATVRPRSFQLLERTVLPQRQRLLQELFGARMIT